MIRCGRFSVPRGAMRSMRSTASSVDKTASFAMSGCGWLIPFYLGVIESMQTHGYLTDKSICAGTSGGALGALIACSGIHPRIGLEAIMSLSLNENFKSNIDVGLRKIIPPLLPPDILDRCNDRLHVVVTKLWPNPTSAPTIISRFESKEFLVDVVAASCFIPLYSAPKTLFTRISSLPEEYFMDGGVFGFMPPIGDIRVSPFPSHPLRRARPPHIYVRSSKFSMPRLISYVLRPPPPEVLEELYQEGKRAGDLWVRTREQRGFSQTDKGVPQATRQATSTTSILQKDNILLKFKNIIPTVSSNGAVINQLKNEAVTKLKNLIPDIPKDAMEKLKKSIVPDEGAIIKKIKNIIPGSNRD